MAESIKSDVNKTYRLVNAATTDESMLQWDAEGLELVFSSDQLKVLNDSLLAKLRPQSREAYLDARASARATVAEKDLFNIPSPIMDASIRKMRKPTRNGYHRTWQDGDTVDDWKLLGYSEVRQYKDSSGDVLTYSQKGYKDIGRYPSIKEKVAGAPERELVLLEVPEHRFLELMKGLELNDKAMVKRHSKQFAKEVEDFNRRYGGHGKEVRPSVTYEDGEVEKLS